MFKKVLIGAALLSFVAFSPANAGFKLSLSDGTTTIVVSDNGANDASAFSGAIVFNGTVGAFNFNVTTGVSKPGIGSAVAPHMDLNSINITCFLAAGCSGTAMLTIMLTDTDFTAAGNGRVFVTDIGGTTGGTVNLATYLDNSNAEFGMSTALSALGPFSGGAFSGTASAHTNVLSPASLTLVATVVHTGAVTSSFDAELQIPEPATLALFGAGLVLLGFAMRRRRSVAVAA